MPLHHRHEGHRCKVVAPLLNDVKVWRYGVVQGAEIRDVGRAGFTGPPSRLHTLPRYQQDGP